MGEIRDRVVLVASVVPYLEVGVSLAKAIIIGQLILYSM